MRPAHISAVAMEIAPGLEMKAPSAIRRVDEQLFRLEGCRKTPALMCSWRGPSLHAQGFPSQKHSNALKKVKSWRGLAKGQSFSFSTGFACRSAEKFKGNNDARLGWL